MAWPVNARIRDFVSTVTTITAASLNSIQDAIIGLYGGTKSVVALAIDGVGDTTIAPTAGQFVSDGKAAETTASVVFADGTSAPGVGVGYNLRFQTPTNGTGRVRLYEIRGGWVETTNAAWTGNPGAEWSRDVAGDATMRVLSAGVLTVYYYVTVPATWAIAAWSSSLITTTCGGVNARLDMAAGQDVIATRALQSNQSQWTSVSPGTGTIGAGRGFKGMIPFAAARVTGTGINGAQTLTRSANISTVVRAGLGIYDVTLLSGVNAGAGEYLIPHVTPLDAAAVLWSIDTATPPTGTTFRVNFYTIAGAAADPGTGFYLSVVGG